MTALADRTDAFAAVMGPGRGRPHPPTHLSVKQRALLVQLFWTAQRTPKTTEQLADDKSLRSARPHLFRSEVAPTTQELHDLGLVDQYLDPVAYRINDLGIEALDIDQGPVVGKRGRGPFGT